MLSRLSLLMAFILGVTFAHAQQPAPGGAPGPRASVKPVADGVYIFEYAGYQSMFVANCDLTMFFGSFLGQLMIAVSAIPPSWEA